MNDIESTDYIITNDIDDGLEVNLVCKIFYTILCLTSLSCILYGSIYTYLYNNDPDYNDKVNIVDAQFALLIGIVIFIACLYIAIRYVKTEC